MDEKKIDETLYTRKCQNCGMVNSFVITKKGIETMANRLGYRKESDTAREILDEVSKHFGGKWLVELYKKYGLEWSVEVE